MFGIPRRISTDHHFLGRKRLFLWMGVFRRSDRSNAATPSSPNKLHLCPARTREPPKPHRAYSRRLLAPSTTKSDTSTSTVARTKHCSCRSPGDRRDDRALFAKALPLSCLRDFSPRAHDNAARRRALRESRSTSCSPD